MPGNLDRQEAGYCPKALGRFQCRHKLMTRRIKQRVPPKLAAKVVGKRILVATTIQAEPTRAAVA